MKVLVTGASGFIGSNLVKRLKKKKWKIRVLTRGNKASLLLHNKSFEDVEVISGDISDIKTVKKAVAGVDLIFNLAAALPHHHLSPQKYWQVNVIGVKNLLKVCEGLKLKQLIHVSTVGIYGPGRSGIISENSPIKLTDVYSITKAKAEEEIAKYIKKGMPITIIRPTIGYGPGDTRPGFLNLFKLIKKGIFIPIGNGINYFHTIYVDNLIDALILVTTKKEAIGQDFIIGDYPCPNLDNIYKKIAKIEKSKILKLYIPLSLAKAVGSIFDVIQKFGITMPLSSQRVKFLTENRRYSIDKVRTVLGFNPKIGLEEGLKRTYKWYKENRHL